MGYRPDRVLTHLNKSDTPRGLRCTATDCKGTLVRKPDEPIPGVKGYYGSPECNVCGKVYPLARNVPKVARTKKISLR